MLGIRYIRAEPTDYLLCYKNGKIVREGRGLSFFYYAPTTSLIRVPVASTDSPFIFEEVTADYQSVTIQGQVTFRISEPKKVAEMLNFTIDPSRRRYVSDDPTKLPQRVIQLIQVMVRSALQQLTLTNALGASDRLVSAIRERLASAPELSNLGVEVVGLSILAIRPTPETARALESEVRESLLRKMDEAIYMRRNAAIEQERAIKENELNTELAVGAKERQIREAQLEADRAAAEMSRRIGDEEMTGKIALEDKRKSLVSLESENRRKEADARGYAMNAAMQPLSGVDPKIIQALATVGMKPEQLISAAFRDLAASADKIGQLNISPDLLRELMGRDGPPHSASQGSQPASPRK